MHVTKKIISYFLLFAGYLMALLTFLSLLQNTSKWYLQILNFPRLQMLIILLTCLVLSIWLKRMRSKIFVAATALAIFINVWFLYPYLPFAQKKLQQANESAYRSQGFSILLANVYMKNRNADALIDMAKKEQPTFILAMEVNDWWVTQLNVLKTAYPYTILYPRDNTYGMALYSKIELRDPGILFFNHDNVPSFYTTILLNDTASIQLLTVHPVAPKSSKHPDNVNQPELALIKAGHKVASSKYPVIVAGDFNDVGWSPNSKKFEEISGLRDVRHGRGLFNTFKAGSWIMRWPLDYVYADTSFAVYNIERLPAIGSDHFPLLVKMKL
jgi:endonuclease/exonuclease/phosphatase (EEP) superfamily protein YafD